MTLKTFDSAIDAHLTKSLLSNEGIVSFVFDEHIMTLQPYYNIVVGGVKLKVAAVDEDAARQVIKTVEQRPFTDKHNDALKCPHCGSADFYPGVKSFEGWKGVLSAIVTLLFVPYPPYLRRSFKCKKCGNTFDNT